MLDELAPRTTDDLTHRRRHQHLTGSGQRRHPRTDVHGHAGDIGAAHFDFTRMDARPHLDAERSDRVDDRVRAVDRNAGTGECRDESVSGRVDFTATVALQFVADDVVVVVEQVVSAVVAERCGALRGADNVGENDCGENTFGVEAAAHARDELFDLIEHRRGLAHPVQRVGTKQLDVGPGSTTRSTGPSPKTW
jgi:hypothetical protein